MWIKVSSQKQYLGRKTFVKKTINNIFGQKEFRSENNLCQKIFFDQKLS